MGFMADIDEDIAKARLLEKKNAHCGCSNPDVCPKCIKRRVEIADLKGTVADMSDIRILKMMGW